MKLSICMLVLVGAIVMVKGEDCHSDGDCSHVTCPDNNYVLDCHSRQCTCTHTSQSCSSASDCQDDKCDHTFHCVDQRCRCGFFGGSGK